MTSSTKKLSSNWKDLQKKLRTSTSPSASPGAEDRVSKPKMNTKGKDKRNVPLKTNNGLQNDLKADLNDGPSRNYTSLNGSATSNTASNSSSASSSRPVPTLPKDIKPARLLLLDDSDLSTHRSIPPTIVYNEPRKQEMGRFVGLDCEFVGTGPNGDISILARVSIVNYFGYTLLDTFVRPNQRVTDWRTWVSGVTPNSVRGAPSLREVQNQVSNILQGRVLVGHSVRHDLEVMMLSHPKNDIRDTSLYGPFREIARGKTPSLKTLSKHFLGLEIQTGEHSSVEDAQATMLLYRLHRTGIERGHHNVRRGGARPRR